MEIKIDLQKIKLLFKGMRGAKMRYDIEEIGKRLRHEREKHKMTQAKLAKVLHVTNKQISNYERGILLPPFEKLLDLCDIFECELGYLLGEKEYENKTILKTAVCNMTGLSAKAVDSLMKITTDTEKSEKTTIVLNQLLEMSSFSEFVDRLTEITQLRSESDSLADAFLEKHTTGLIKEAIIALINPKTDYMNDEEYKKQNPEVFEVIKEMNDFNDKGEEKEYEIDVARYRLHKLMEHMIDEMHI